MAETTPEFTATCEAPERLRVDMLFVPLFQDDDELSDIAGLDAATGGEIARARARGEFRARPFEFFLTRVVDNRWQCARLALVGAASRKDLHVERMRRIAAACSYTATLRSVDTVAFLL